LYHDNAHKPQVRKALRLLKLVNFFLDQPILMNGQVRESHEYALFCDLHRRYDWVLPIYRYHNTSSLIASIKEQIIMPAEQKAQELERR